MRNNHLFTLCAANPDIMMTRLGFTSVQYHILLQCIQGLTGKQTAVSLAISYSRVRWHKNRMLKKFQADNMNQVIVATADIAIEALVLKHRGKKND